MNTTPIRDSNDTPPDPIGRYVTAYSSDLGPDLVGQLLVMFNHYESWDEDAGVEIVSDIAGQYRVRPNPANRIGSAGPDDKVTIGRLAPDLILGDRLLGRERRTGHGPGRIRRVDGRSAVRMMDAIQTPPRLAPCRRCGLMVNVKSSICWRCGVDIRPPWRHNPEVAARIVRGTWAVHKGRSSL